MNQKNSMRPPAPQRPGPWTEAARVAIALVWAATLTLWLFTLVVTLEHFPTWPWTLAYVGNKVRVSAPLFWTALLPSLAVALALHTAAYARRPRRTLGSPEEPIERRAWAQAWMSLAVVVGLWVLLWRVLSCYAFAFAPTDPSPLSYAVIFGEPPVWSSGTILPTAILLGACGLVLLTFQAWHLVPRFGGRRRTVVVIVAIGLSAGIVMTGLRLVHALPSVLPVSPGDFLDSPAEASLILGVELDRAGGEALARDSFRTHGPDGEALRYLDAFRGRFADRYELSTLEYLHQRCEVCLLPVIPAWSLRGVPVALKPDPPVSAGPTAILELPLGGDRIRVDPLGMETASAPVPLDELEARLPVGDWVLVKIDFGLPMAEVADLLERLSSVGIARVDLAAVPAGVPNRTFAQPLALSFADHPEASAHALARGEREKQIIVVRISIPPPHVEPLPWCEDIGADNVTDAVDRWRIPAPGSAPQRVRMRVHPEERYGEWLPRIALHALGGAGSAHVLLDDAVPVTAPRTGTTIQFAEPDGPADPERPSH